MKKILFVSSEVSPYAKSGGLADVLGSLPKALAQKGHECIVVLPKYQDIKLADTYGLDVLIVGRGGGSIEDLWPFNEEIVARAIYEANVPIISAVGHEVDFTIADFVSDLRAPTPTGAAELAVPNQTDVLKHIEQLRIRANENIYKKINYQKLYLD